MFRKSLEALMKSYFIKEDILATYTFNDLKGLTIFRRSYSIVIKSRPIF